jgi:hypothetical protein
MATITMKRTVLMCFAELIHKMSATVKQSLINWLSTQQDMQNYWDRYRTVSAGNHVSYRVWSRHSAYLEIIQDARQHNGQVR